MIGRRTFGAATAAAVLARPALAQRTPFKLGLILPMTGPFASTGRQIDAACRLYLAQHADPADGRRIEIVLRDDASVADTTRRLAQELAVRERVGALAGFGLTPLALAVAPVATEARLPMIVMAAATLIIPSRSPFCLRSGFTLPQVTAPMAEWSARNGIRKVVTLCTDFAPGVDAETTFKTKFGTLGGSVVESLRTPLRNPDYAPFLQRARDARPDALFVFCPSGEGANIMKQFAERGLADAGIKLIGTGDVTDDDILNDMGAPVLGAITSHHYSVAHDSPENRAFVAAFKRANPAMRPNFMAVGGWDGMHVLSEGLRKTNGTGTGEALVAAMKDLAWTSPRGPMRLVPDARDVQQDVYIRRAERHDGEIYNMEFDTIAQVPPAG